MKLKKVISLAAVSVLSLGAVGCQTEQPAAPPPPPPATQPEQPAPGETAPAPEETAPTPGEASPTPNVEERNAAALRAITTAQQAENGTAYEIDEGDDNTWEVIMVVGERTVQANVSADGNTVISQGDATVDEEARNRLDRAQITLSQAIENALREVPGSLDDVDLDADNARDAWQVTIDTAENQGVEVYVSPEDGSIIRVER